MLNHRGCRARASIHLLCCVCPALCAPQAQFVAALRAALKPGAAPALAVCGGTLATSFLSAGLAAGDGAVMRRLMDLLVAPLQVGAAAAAGSATAGSGRGSWRAGLDSSYRWLCIE